MLLSALPIPMELFELIHRAVTGTAMQLQAWHQRAKMPMKLIKIRPPTRVPHATLTEILPLNSNEKASFFVEDFFQISQQPLMPPHSAKLRNSSPAPSIAPSPTSLEAITGKML